MGTGQAANDLGRQIAATIDELQLPEGDLVARVLDDVVLARGVRSPASWRGRWWGSRRMPRLGLAMAASTLLVVLAVLAIEPARSAVADILGFGATRIDQGTESSTTPPTATTADSAAAAVPSSSTEPPQTTAPAGSAGPTGPAADTGVNPLPILGQPLIEDGDSARRRRYLWLADEALPALDNSDYGLSLEVRTLDGAPDTKLLGGQPGAEFITIEVESGQVQALWIPSYHNRLLSEGATGQPTEPVRAGPTLLWVVDEIQLRLEADVGLERAIELAASVTGGTGLLAPG